MPARHAPAPQIELPAPSLVVGRMPMLDLATELEPPLRARPDIPLPAPDDALAGTLVCGVDDSDGANAAVDLALDLGSRLGVRVVLAAVGDAIVDEHGRPVESLTTRAARDGARRLLERIARERDLGAAVTLRYDLGEPAAGLARVAHEER